jgi:hypothetical protein
MHPAPTKRITAHTCAAALLTLFLMASAPPLAARQPQREAQGSDAGFLALNTLLGAGTAALHAALRGENVPRAVLTGAGGGAVVYAGKRVVATEFAGAGLAGRSIAAVGTSIVLNAGHGRRPLSRVLLPLGPVHLHLDLDDSPGLDAIRVNASELIVLAWLVSRPELAFDWNATLRHGAPVFYAADHEIRSGDVLVDGLAFNGAVVISGFRSSSRSQVTRHEVVHVLQNDFVSAAWSAPLEALFMRQQTWGERTLRYVQPGLVHLMVLSLRPYRGVFEDEARFLEHQ